MGEAYICRRGGVSAQNAAGGYALICVKFPAYSDCTCSKGSASFTLYNGSGTAAFAVTESGTWTVSISDGTDNSTANVSITAAGEIRTIELSYGAAPVTGSTVLLSAEDGLADGYSLGGNAAMSGNAIQESGNGGFWLSPAVDLSGFSSLTVSGVLLSSTNAQSRIGAGSTMGKVSELVQTPEAWAAWPYLCDVEGSLTIDISSLSGSYYIGSALVGNRLKLTGIVLS